MIEKCPNTDFHDRPILDARDTSLARGVHGKNVKKVQAVIKECTRRGFTLFRGREGYTKHHPSDENYKKIIGIETGDGTLILRLFSLLIWGGGGGAMHMLGGTNRDHHLLILWVGGSCPSRIILTIYSSLP